MNSEETALTTHETAVQATQSVPSVLAVINQATMSGADIEAMQGLYDLYERDQEREAKKEFSKAMAKFQQECPIIAKLDEAYGGKKYARMDRIWREIRPLLKECGLSIVWYSSKIDTERNFCVLDGCLTHTSGYSQDVHSEIAIPEIIKGQNKAQVIGSAITYCKRYATCGILGIQTGVDDDASACDNIETISPAQVAVIEGLIAQVNDGEKRKPNMLKTYGISSIEELPAKQFDSCCKIWRKSIENQEAEAEMKEKGLL